MINESTKWHEKTSTSRASRCTTFSLLVACMILGWSTPADAANKLQELADRYWEARLDHDPTMATSMGDYRSLDRLSDVSARARHQWRATLEAFLSKTSKLPLEGLSGDDVLTRTLLERSIRDALLRDKCNLHRTPLDPLDGPQISFPLILVSQPFRNASDYRKYAARLRAFQRYVDDLIANMREGIASGQVSPRVTIEKVVPQIAIHIVKDVNGSEFYKPLKEAKNLPAGDAMAVRDEITKAIEQQVIPSYRRLLAFVEGEYLPACRATVGIGAVPNGDTIYAALAYLFTTVHQSPDEIHEIGLAEVRRIRGEMRRVQEELKYPGTLDDFLAHMRDDPSYRFNSSGELYETAGKILERTKPLMSRLFGRIPKADCVMKEIESFRASSSPVAYYNPPPEDASRPGYYYINVYKPEDRLRFTLEALTYHESIPGHHFQIALDQENKDLPRFRRYGSFTAYVEGWALYTEKLGYEIGGYRNPYAKFGQLTFEMWRACRLVVDTGMHAKGWPRQRAIDFLAANTSLALLDIGAEVDRYISWPGQALAYKIGELRIFQLRKDAEGQLGDKFDLRAFHDALLSGGAMPIDVLETRMHAWIAEQ